MGEFREHLNFTSFIPFYLEKHGNPDPSVVKEIEVTTTEQRLGIEDSTNNMPTSAQHPDSFPYKATLLFDNETRVVKGWMKI